MIVIDPKATISEVLNRHPSAMRVFIDHGMACIGCVVAPYHTLEEACTEYDLMVEGFLHEMAEATSDGASH